MHKFAKWFIVSMLLALISTFLLLHVEDWARQSGEMNRTLLLFGILATFILVLLSLFFLFKANVEREKAKIVLSLLSAVFPLLVFIMNSITFSVWFIGK